MVLGYVMDVQSAGLVRVEVESKPELGVAGAAAVAVERALPSPSPYLVEGPCLDLEEIRGVGNPRMLFDAFEVLFARVALWS